MQDLNDLYYFVQVVDHSGFAAAGRALGIPKSRLSRRIAALEERLGVRLIQRSTRRFSVTEVGGIYYGHCKAMLVEAEAAQEAVERTRAEPCGTVRITCPVTLLHAGIDAMLAEYLAIHPGVSLQLEATNRRVDVVGEGIDIAIRARTPPLDDSELMMRVLARRTWCLVAAPALLAAGAGPLQPADLPGLPSLAMGRPQDRHAWELRGPDGAAVTIPHAPRLVSEDMRALRVAALHGVGVVELPEMVVAADLEAGRLLRLVPGWTSRSGLVHAVYASRRGLLPSVRGLLDHLGARFAEIDSSAGGQPATTPPT